MGNLKRKRSESSCTSSPGNVEGGTGGEVEGSGQLKKGPWSSAEDDILRDYVNKHGEGNWNAVQKNSGLSRCGKSCRLRWTNHLRSDLKKGAFTPEEECKIIELHAKMGNKWARMALELPGRTDNEIKNFWNTRTKRRQRAGLPIYPSDICFQANNENQQGQNTLTFGTGVKYDTQISSSNEFEIPPVEFEYFNQESYPPALFSMPGNSFLDMKGTSLLPQGIDSSYSNSFMFPSAHPYCKHICSRSETMFPSLGDSVDQYQEDDSSEKTARSLDISSPCDQNLIASSFSLPGTHAYSNGNSSSSEPFPWAMKLELPSLQYPTQVGSWDVTPFNTLPSLESVDTLMQSPPNQQTNSDSLLRQNSGLLDAVPYGSENLITSNNISDDLVSTVDVAHMSKKLQTRELEVCGDPISHLSRSASIFDECTPFGDSLDEHQSVQTKSDHDSTESDKKLGIKKQMDSLRPDFLLGHGKMW